MTRDHGVVTFATNPIAQAAIRGTSAQRDESRLTPDDIGRMRVAVDRAVTAGETNPDLLDLAAAHSIGCTLHDLRTSERNTITIIVAEALVARPDPTGATR